MTLHHDSDSTKPGPGSDYFDPRNHLWDGTTLWTSIGLGGGAALTGAGLTIRLRLNSVFRRGDAAIRLHSQPAKRMEGGRMISTALIRDSS
jgi:hypothetical protein